MRSKSLTFGRALFCQKTNISIIMVIMLENFEHARLKNGIKYVPLPVLFCCRSYMDIQVSQLNVRVSYNDVMLFLNIFRSMAGKGGKKGENVAVFFAPSFKYTGVATDITMCVYH